ncbi:TetR/AcrR family transcriptional regulator [Desertimonas flava]|jgi:AcrR family transcriptional regulator|uniref:TetR/AcrR family transcriptional regulator n=1 Tax=Desertimonas flava TaxID=2064846 RepID=UPI000E343B3D|nr:TetR/AcrR family transcriptional regulator [Desertimonas flava]
MATTARGERTRNAFRDAARTVIARKGFLRTTISEIAEEAGRSPASFYNYYESKEDLLAELADEFRRETEENRDTEPVTPGTPLYELMHRAAEAYWTAYKRHLAELVGVFQTAMLDDRFAEEWRRIRVVGIQTIRESIDHAQRHGYCPGIDPWLTATALGSMFEHFCYVSLAQGGAFADHPVTDDGAVDTMTSILFHSVFWTADGPQPTVGTATPG